ncbi:unnamed protein product [Auanema sp. JU1783]|nr:unnamed protein product [Auanema sp. JU1783]
MDDNFKDLVLVTGASGYVALHCVRELLENGYRVRGTVRDKNNKQKIAPLLRLPYANDRLELVEADLLKPDQWPSAISGCDYILHVASPWPIVADESVIKTAVEGTLNVLQAAAKCSEIKKIVLTSSCAAVNDGHKNSSRIFDETCWTDLNSSSVEYYAKSKTMAETAAWNYWKSIERENKYDLTVLNPTFVTGPVLSDVEHGSATIIGRMMDIRTYLAAPHVSLGIVDVRDVAKAHVLALKNKESNGERILITSQPSVWFKDMTKWLRKEFQKQGYYITPIETPTFLLKLYAATKIDPQVAAVMHRVGPELRFDNSKSLRLFQMKYIDPKVSVLEMMYSMISCGMVKATKKFVKCQEKKFKKVKCEA